VSRVHSSVRLPSFRAVRAGRRASVGGMREDALDRPSSPQPHHLHLPFLTHTRPALHRPACPHLIGRWRCPAPGPQHQHRRPCRRGCTRGCPSLRSPVSLPPAVRRPARPPAARRRPPGPVRFSHAPGRGAAAIRHDHARGGGSPAVGFPHASGGGGACFCGACCCGACCWGSCQPGPVRFPHAPGGCGGGGGAHTGAARCHSCSPAAVGFPHAAGRARGGHDHRGPQQQRRRRRCLWPPFRVPPAARPAYR